MEQCSVNLKALLPHGAISTIAKSLGVSVPAVSKALKQGKPGSRIVQEAMRIAQETGALSTAQAIASLTHS